MHYLIGDIQGCCGALERLLAEVDFSASRDHVYLLGDLVNRGPESLRTLQRLASLGPAAHCLLGNHDLHFLAAAAGVRRVHRSDTFADVLEAPDRAHWVDWLRHQHLALSAQGWLMVHAGVVPQWTPEMTLDLAAEVEQQLRTGRLHDTLEHMYGNEPRRWDPALQSHDRLRFTVNVLTRIRFCTVDGQLDLETKDGAGSAPSGHLPWFEVPGRATAGVPIAFGHWSTLGLVNRPDLLALDTGCVWGGSLTAVRVDQGSREVFQVPCPQAQNPHSPATPPG